MSEVHVFTSAAYNYIPKVRLLFQSLRKYHPEWRLHLALADEKREGIDLSDEPFDEVVALEDLDIPNWRGWAYCHSIVELATAIKPFMLAQLLKREGTQKVIYFDPDMVVFSELNDILDALDNANILLTPHQTTPEQSLSAVIDNEICSLKHGIYNLGFLAVSANEVGHQFADWWSKRLYYFCRADISNGLFTDQRWIDLVPAFFAGVSIMSSSRHNVASWNLTTRKLTLSQTGDYLVNDEPLGFYHFTGFDSGDHDVMSKKNSRNNSTVSKLVDWYSIETSKLSNDPLSEIPWAFGTYTDGIKISPAQRLIYRERTDLQTAFPDPFDPDTFLAWWNSQAIFEYPDLFDEATRELAIRDLSTRLTPGYRGHNTDLDWNKVGLALRQSLESPKSAVKAGGRVWNILRVEGFSGIMSRLRS